MTKIIRKRNKLKCNVCKSTFRFEREDIQEKRWGSNGQNRYYYVECPVCKAERKTSY